MNQLVGATAIYTARTRLRLVRVHWGEGAGLVHAAEPFLVVARGHGGHARDLEVSDGADGAAAAGVGADTALEAAEPALLGSGGGAERGKEEEEGTEG